MAKARTYPAAGMAPVATLAAAVTGLAMTGAAMLHCLPPYLPLPARQDVSQRLWGWEELARRVADPRPPGSGDDAGKEEALILTLRYQEASVLRFHRKHLGVARWLLARGLFTTSMIARTAWWRLRSALTGSAQAQHKARLSAAAARYHLTGRKPSW